MFKELCRLFEIVSNVFRLLTPFACMFRPFTMCFTFVGPRVLLWDCFCRDEIILLSKLS